MTLHLDDKVAGAVLGAAIGDALGHPTEFLSAESIRQRFPPDGVEGYELWWEREGERFAPYTDDTQMAEVVLRSLVKGRRTGANLESVMADMAAGFVEWRTNPQGGHRTPGNACLEGAAQLAAGLHWSTTGGERAGGCGSVMRAYPFGVVFVNNLAQAEEWAVQHSAMTHRDPIALAACAAMAIGVGMTLAGEPVDVVLEAMVTVAARYSLPTAEMMRAAIADARAGSDPLSILKRLEGWAAHEAISAAAFIVARHHNDVRSAILEGANAYGDSDSIATLAGALVGARVGLTALPNEWVRDLERSTDLLELAKVASRFAEDAAGP